jgi:DNA-binding NtrC family response regulator
MGRAWKRTVLVVEDDQLQRELVSLIFEESDMHVIQCMSGEAAAVVLEKSGPELTMMFTDVDLEGGMSGIDLVKIARQRFPAIDVIVTSGREVGAIPDDVLFMPKPWLPLDLLREAERSCRRHGVHLTY